MQRFTPSQFNSVVVPATVGGGVALAALVWLCPAARAETLTAWQFDPATQELTLTLPTGVVPQYAPSATGDRLVLTIPQTQLGNVPTIGIYDGLVQHIQLFPQGDGVEITLTLSPGVALATDPAQLVSVVAGAETRWTFTPQMAQVSPGAPSNLGSNPGSAPAPGMIVELPPLPADPNLSWPYTGVGRLSISAANLVQPANLDTFNTLPDTLAIDPFNLGLPDVAQQVTVPSLEELDAAVGSPLPGPTVVVPSLGSATNLATAPTAGRSNVIATSPPSGQSSSGQSSSDQTAAPVLAQGMPPTIDQETNGLAISVNPAPVSTAPVSPAPANSASNTTVPTASVSPAPTSPAPTNSAPAAAPAAPGTATAPTTPRPVPATPTVAATVAPSTTATVAAAPITTQPPTPGRNPVAQVPSNAAPAVNAVEPPFLTVPPPTVNSSMPTVANQPTATNPTLLAVPSQPATTTTGVVIPPNLAAEPIPVAAAPNTAIDFGQPLPGQGANGAEPAWGDRRLAPDTLIAAGSILELRYTGPASLTLDPSTVHQEVLVLETEIRDPVTNGIVAPAGSQLIGQFKANGDGHQWVSQMLIAPDGQRIPFASTSDYVYNSPQVNGGTLALGTGLGALALTLLTGFGGIGLLGGALIGATTVVGTAPQMLVIEPNQVIYAEVMQDIYRSMPIATAPTETQEWGAVPGTWGTP